MALTRVADRVHVIRGMVNIYLLNIEDGLALVDTGLPGSAPKVLDAVRELGFRSNQVRHILLSHAHPDHIGSAAALKRETGAHVWANPIDAPIMRAGTGIRPVYATPGLKNAIITRFLLGRIKQLDPVEVDSYLENGQRPPFLPDMLTIHLPGHCAGQNAFLWERDGGILFPADACINSFGPKLPPAVEDLGLARNSLERLKQFEFQTICFMHGKPITESGARAIRRAKFGG